MPEIVTHFFFAQRIREHLPEHVHDQIDPEMYALGARGPDPLGIVFFYNLPRWKKEHGKSNLLHTQGCANLFRSLAEAAKDATKDRKSQLFSYLSGFLTHYALDSTCHPYIIDRAGTGPENAGNHRSLEHAMDRKRLQLEGMNLRERPITTRIHPPKVIPVSIKKEIDEIYQTVFGWQDAWKLLNQAYQDERRFLHIMEDPHGRVFAFIRKVTRNRNLLSLSYAEDSYRDADIYNERHREWHNPYAPEIISKESMTNLEARADDSAMNWIKDLYAFIFEDGSYPETLGNRSFESGLEADDPRNTQSLTCHVMAGR